MLLLILSIIPNVFKNESKNIGIKIKIKTVLNNFEIFILKKLNVNADKLYENIPCTGIKKKLLIRTIAPIGFFNNPGIMIKFNIPNSPNVFQKTRNNK